MAAYAALVSLMNNIDQIQSHTRLPISLDNDQMESLHEKVCFLIDFLESYNSHGDCKEMKDLEGRITDAAYAAEDIIETHVVNKLIYRSTPSRKRKKIIPISTGQGIEKVMEDIDLLKEEVMKIKDKWVIEDLQPRSPINVAPSSSSIPVGKNTMVGFDDELNRVMERLTGRQPSRQIIPIVGMGGIGKTTLAKTAYERQLIAKHFDFCAWVSISQEYDLKTIILGLLPDELRQMIDKESNQMSNKESSQMSDEESNQMSNNRLGEMLHKSLYGRRYLVVLDDMWSVKAWEMVQLFLPDDNNGSRLIVTTRISSVATHLDSCSLEMNFLDEDKSWNLFCEKVFAQEGCPWELEDVGRKIVKNCKGLPLSIVVIGGILAKSERTKEYWEYIARDTKEIISLEGDEHCMRMLYLSYHHLPINLKPCFLYMGVFDEDEEIRASFIINLWVGEGFLKPNSSKELEVVGEEYINDLISRNLILVHTRGSTGKIKSCMMHDLLRDLCLNEAHKRKFLFVPKMYSQDAIQGIGSQRRVSIPKSLYIPRRLYTQYNRKRNLLGRSLICNADMVFPLENLWFLRVLKGSDKYGYVYTLDDTFKLVNSRFIAINCNENAQFPSSIRYLWNLQILIVRNVSEWDNVIAPLVIWEMTELRHLSFKHSLTLPDPPSERQDKRGGDAVMKNLHTLENIKNFKFSDEVVKRIPNIKKLQIFHEISSVKELEEYGLKNLGLLEKLESLKWSLELLIQFDVLSNLAFPTSLKKLTLSKCFLPWEYMTMIGSLPHLEVLKLKFNAFEGDEWVTNDEEFCCLKYLEIYSSRYLVHWIADNTHFPCLEHLVLRWLPKLVEIPSGIGEIPTLQSIMLRYCSNSSVISTKKILEEQEDLGNVGLQVHVICDSEDAEVESLASDNFIVQVRKS